MNKLLITMGLLFGLAACAPATPEPIQDYNAPYLGGKGDVSVPPVTLVPPVTVVLNCKVKVNGVWIPGNCDNSDPKLPPVVNCVGTECDPVTPPECEVDCGPVDPPECEVDCGPVVETPLGANPGNNKPVGKATENPTGSDKHHRTSGSGGTGDGSTGASSTSQEGGKGPHEGSDDYSAKDKKVNGRDSAPGQNKN